MSEPLSRLYDLALRTLDDQERRADALRGRLGPTLAAAALGVTLLSGSLVGGKPPHGVVGKLALLVAVAGFFFAVFNAVAILTSRGLLATEADLRDLANALEEGGALEDPAAFYPPMITRFSRNATKNAGLLDQLHGRFTAMLWGILVMLCGLALVALVGSITCREDSRSKRPGGSESRSHPSV